MTRILLIGLLLALPAAAQELELDLTGEEKQPEIPPEMRPTIAVLSVKAADTEEVSAGRAKLLETEFIKQLQTSDRFTTVMDPSGSRLGLGADFAKTDTCGEFACLEAGAKKLKVHRLVRLTVQKHNAGSLVTMYGWDPGFNEVLVVSQESGEKAEKTFLGVAGKTQAQKDREFLRKMSGFINQVQKTMSIPNGKIVVDNPDPSALVLLDGVEQGVGNQEVIAQRGSRTIKVTSAGYKPFEQTVTVEQGKQIDVKAQLVAIPIEVVEVKKVVVEEVSIFARPGFYVTLIGAAAIATGIALGQSAAGVQAKLNAGGDPVGLTRVEAKAAPTNALLANILVGGGAAAMAGGITWIIVSLPPPPPKVVPKTGTGEPTETVTPVPGAFISVGGSF
ncbi:MAG: PEGA domain-containing protein [Archangium sp.]|nr:PEGA domain-containing protein [Archangium sp.]